MRGAVAFLISVAAMVTALSATFSTPALAAGRAHHTVAANRAAIRPASPRHFATPQPRAPASCETRGCRAASFTRPESMVLVVHVLPGHRYQAAACAYEFASRLAVAGGDPVNDSDPTGLSCDNPNPNVQAQCVANIRAQQPSSCPASQELVEGACEQIGTAPGDICPDPDATIGCDSAAWNANNSFDQGCSETYGNWNCAVMAIDPAYSAISGAYNAWEAAQSPCSSNWTIAGYAAQGFLGAAGTVGIGLGAGEAVESSGLGDSMRGWYQSQDFNDVGAFSGGGHANQLPTEGEFAYEPPAGSQGQPLRLGGRQGFRDADGNLWQWARTNIQHYGPHWDVQLKGGGYINVSPDGRIL